MDVSKMTTSKHFNSQPHEEADLTQRLSRLERVHFNSQPHEEADGRKDISMAVTGISTHSLTKRLTYGRH